MARKNKAEQKEIHCKGFVLREWRKEDIPSLTANANNKRIWINLRDAFPHPYTEKDAQQWLRTVKSLPGNSNFAIVLRGRAIGGIGAVFRGDVEKHSAEIGFWLGERYWGRGIMTEAIVKTSEFLFENFDINRIFARVFDWNKSSVRVLEKSGFVLEGRLREHIFKNGVFTDELVFGLLKQKK